jgi:hypothetical protein
MDFHGSLIDRTDLSGEIYELARRLSVARSYDPGVSC